MPLMKAVEWFLERAPGVRRCSAHNVVLATRRRQS
jgi:hypothetical protein